MSELHHHPDSCPTCGAPTAGGRFAPELDDSTRRLPPLTETVRRRPPPPPVRELRGSALLRALADELDRDADVTGDDL